MLLLLQQLIKGSGDGQSEAAILEIPCRYWRKPWQNSRYHNTTTIRTFNLSYTRPGRHSFVDLFRPVVRVITRRWDSVCHDAHIGFVGRTACLGLALRDLDWSGSETASNGPSLASGLKYQGVPFAFHTHHYCCWWWLWCSFGIPTQIATVSLCKWHNHI